MTDPVPDAGGLAAAEAAALGAFMDGGVSIARLRKYRDAVAAAAMAEANARIAMLEAALREIVTKYDERNRATGFVEHMSIDNEFTRAAVVLTPATPEPPCAKCGKAKVTHRYLDHEYVAP